MAEPVTIERSDERRSQPPGLPLESFFDDETIAAIARLPLLQGQVLGLRYLIDLPWDQVAVELERSWRASRRSSGCCASL